MTNWSTFAKAKALFNSSGTLTVSAVPTAEVTELPQLAKKETRSDAGFFLSS
jgi:hypothetical protein